MAGIIDIRYNLKTRRWVAKPRFAYDRESYQNGAPSVEGLTPYLAAYNLTQLLPEELGRQLSQQIPHRIYRSPEYEWKDDKCVEMDGHCPYRYEWGQRRIKYLREKGELK